MDKSLKVIDAMRLAGIKAICNCHDDEGRIRLTPEERCNLIDAVVHFVKGWQLESAQATPSVAFAIGSACAAMDAVLDRLFDEQGERPLSDPVLKDAMWWLADFMQALRVAYFIAPPAPSPASSKQH